MVVNKQNYLVTYVCIAILALFVCLVGGAKTHAISGASTYFPDTSPAGQLPSYGIVQVTGTAVAGANAKMKARTTVASVYVPQGMVGSQINLTIVNGCNGTIRDNDPGFGTTRFTILNITTGAVLGLVTTGYAGCATANKNIPISFTATALNTGSAIYPHSRTYDSGIEYNIYQFVADGIMTEAGNTHRYLNAFGLDPVTGSVQVGISDLPVRCDNANYGLSCPTPRNYNGSVASWVYTSFYGPTQAVFMPSYNQQIKLRNSCGVNAGISLYDLDASDAGLTAQANLKIVMRQRNPATGVYSPLGVVMLNGGTFYELPKAAIQSWGPGIGGVMRSHPGFGGNNNEYMDLPGGDPTFTPVANIPQDTDYTFSIENIDSDNAIQILPSIDHCPAPVADTAPTVSISQNCSAPYTVTITVNDADYASNGGSPVINYSVNGVGQPAVRARTTTFNMPDPTASVTINANSTGVNPNPPGGDGPAGASRSASATLSPCGYTFNLTSQPQPPNLNDPELPTSATAISLIGFSGGASAVNGVTTTRTYFRNRGGVYNAIAGTITGGANVGIQANATQVINVSSKPTDNTLGTANIVGIAGIQAADYICMSLTVTPSSGMVNSVGTLLAGAGGSSAKTQCAPVVNRPYMKVFGSDILAGSGFGSSCTAAVAPAPLPGVIGFAKQLAAAPNQWVGGGTQMGVFASGVVDQFASSSILNPTSPGSLVFANTSAAGASLVTGSVFGGSYNSKFCNHDFWASKSTALTAGNGAIPALHALQDGQYQYNSGSVINSAPQDITNRIAIYIDGDVTINTDIRLASVGAATIDQLPSFYLIARGNIYIAPNVTRLDGVYVAMPKFPATNTNTPNDGGRIFTCTSNGPAPGAELTGVCLTSRLTINGFFSASRVNFLRGAGSLRSAVAAETAASTNIAETFNFLPETLLALPAPSVTSTGQYDSVISLPPAL